MQSSYLNFIKHYKPVCKYLSFTTKLFDIDKLIKIVEVGPRDGLQNEKFIIPTDVKTGIECIEVSSFVHSKWVPQLADASLVFERINRCPNINYSALVPNETGMIKALKSKPNSIAVFVAASETFSKRNINCSIEESFQRLNKIFEIAKQNNLPIRGYISCVVGCPYEGSVSSDRVAEITKALWERGCYEISLGDTIGVGTPESIDQLLSVVLRKHQACPPDAIAIHCHDTKGNALNNITTALENHSVRVVDSSVAGLGGCPYAGPGVSGNVSTEAVVAHLIKKGYEFTKPLNQNEIIKIGQWIKQKIDESKHQEAH